MPIWVNLDGWGIGPKNSENFGLSKLFDACLESSELLAMGLGAKVRNTGKLLKHHQSDG